MAYIEARLPHLQRSSSHRTTSDASVYSYPEIRDMNRLSQRINTSQSSLINGRTLSMLDQGHDTNSTTNTRIEPKVRQDGAPTSTSGMISLNVSKTLRECATRRKTATLIDKWSLYGAMNSEKHKPDDTQRQHEHKQQQRDCVAQHMKGHVPEIETPSVLSRARSFLSRSVGRTRKTLKVRV